MKLRVILEPSEEGGYTALVPSLPGCISEGETREEALKNIKDAIELYLESIDDDLHFSEGNYHSHGKTGIKKKTDHCSCSDRGKSSICRRDL